MDRPDDYDLYIEEGMESEEARYYEEMEHLKYIEDLHLAIAGLEEMERVVEYVVRLDETNTRTEEDIRDLKRHYNLAKYALEKETPKRPQEGTRAVKVGMDGANCICGKLIFSSDNYCNKCGQRLDWRE